MKTDGEVAILSVDVGTSATKAALFFPSSGTLGHVFRESYETCAGKNGKVTQRPEDWLEATLTASRNALDGSDAHVAAISVTGKRHI